MGFEDEKLGWENFAKMRGDVPGMINDFIEEIKKVGTAGQKSIIASV